MAINKVVLGTQPLLDLTGDNVTAADVLAGVLFHLPSGVQAVGTATGGGGLESEQGEFSVSSDTNRLTVPFAKSHSEAPALILFVDATNTSNTTTNTNWVWMWVDFWRIFDNRIYYSSSAMRYAIAYYTYRGSSTSSLSTGSMLCSSNSDSTSASGISYPKYHATNTAFYPYTNSTSRYWRSGRTFKWIAIWA